MARVSESATQMNLFGGMWTELKLEALRKYLDAYTKVLKNKPSRQKRFNLIYVDAFAGTGRVDLRESQDMDKEHPLFPGMDEATGAEVREFLDGSAVIAMEITDRPFDRLLLIEIDTEKVEELDKLVEERKDSHRVDVIHGDANEQVEKFCKGMSRMDRAVVFLDPFGTQVSWSTVQALAESQKCDVWILYPVITLARLLPLDRKPDLPWRINTLNRVFDGNEWEGLYYSSGQTQFIEGGKEEMVRNSGIDEIVGLYSEKLNQVFAEVVPTRRTLRNSKGSPLYELMFAAGNPKGAPIAVDIAKHILQKL